MIRIKHSLLAAALLSMLPLAHAAQQGELLPPKAGDLVPQALSASKRAPVAPMESAPVEFTWALAADAKIDRPTPYVAESREFWSLQDADSLTAGYRFAVGSPGALLRISPAGAGKSAAVALDHVALSFNGRMLRDGDGILRSVGAEQLKALGADFGAGSLVLQIDPALGAGDVELRLPKANGRHLVHVLEPNSDQLLTLSTDRDIALSGDRIGVYVDWRSGTDSRQLDHVDGLLTAPDGRTVALRFEPDADGRYVAEASLPAAADTPGLWEVHSFAAATVDGRQLLRDAKSSFAVSQPSARLAGAYRVSDDDAGLSLQFEVQAAAAGRYELRGTLFGTRADGSLVPFAAAHAARLLDAGNGALTLNVPAALIEAAQVGAPFEVRELALSNQGTMSRLEQRALALRIDRGPPAELADAQQTH